MSEREPDITDDPRQQGTGQGYPEENPEGQTPTEGTDRGPEADRGGSTSSPDSHAGEDEDPGKATGNPDAAGG